MAANNLTAERLRAVLDYDRDSGVFTWRLRISRKIRVGSIAGNIMRNGYVQLMIDGRNYMAHRLAWLYVYGCWPQKVIDHIDGNPTNNRISNLRDVTQRENTENQRHPRSNNAVGLLGVCRNKHRWRATIQSCGRWRHLGTFDTPEEAHSAYLAAKAVLHISAHSPTA